MFVIYYLLLILLILRMNKVKSCPDIIPNGAFQDGCPSTVGSRCTYTCDEGYSPAHPNTTAIECLPSTKWSTNSPHALCTNALQCAEYEIPNGELDLHCRRTPGEICGFVCIDGYRSSTAETLNCNNGTVPSWNKQMSTLCEMPRCNWSIPNGRISYYCDREHGQSCNFYCDTDCNRAIKNFTLYCSFGKWINDDVACKCPDPIVCSSTIPNGRMVNCTLEPTNWCQYECDSNCKSQYYNLYCDDSGAWGSASRACKCPVTGLGTGYIVLIVLMGTAFITVVLIGLYCLMKSKRHRIAQACWKMITCKTCCRRHPVTTPARSRETKKMAKTGVVSGGLSFPEYMTEGNNAAISDFNTPDSYSTPNDASDLRHSDQNTELEQFYNFIIKMQEPKSDRSYLYQPTHKYNEIINTDNEPSIKMVKHTEAAESNSQPPVPGMTDDITEQPSKVTLFQEYDISVHDLQPAPLAGNTSDNPTTITDDDTTDKLVPGMVDDVSGQPAASVFHQYDITSDQPSNQVFHQSDKGNQPSSNEEIVSNTVVFRTAL